MAVVNCVGATGKDAIASIIEKAAGLKLNLSVNGVSLT